MSEAEARRSLTGLRTYNLEDDDDDDRGADARALEDPSDQRCCDCRTAMRRSTNREYGMARTTIQGSIDALNAYMGDQGAEHVSPARHASVRAFANNIIENMLNDGTSRCTAWLRLKTAHTVCLIFDGRTGVIPVQATRLTMKGLRLICR